MTSRIAVPLLAVTLLAAPVFALESSPKPSPATSPAKIAGSPQPRATPAKHAATKRHAKKVASVTTRSTMHGHPHPGPTAAPHAAAATGAVK